MNQSELKGKTAVKVLSLVAGGCALVNLLFTLIFRTSGTVFLNLTQNILPVLNILAPAAILAIFSFAFYKKEKINMFFAIIFIAFSAVELAVLIKNMVDYGVFPLYRNYTYTLMSVYIFPFIRCVLFGIAGAGFFGGFSKKILPLIAVFIFSQTQSNNWAAVIRDISRLRTDEVLFYEIEETLSSIVNLISWVALIMGLLIFLMLNEIPSRSRRVSRPYTPVQQPAYQQPALAYQQPAPAYQQPAPAYQQPAPAYQQPVQQPVYQQPVYQQPIQQPIQQPVYQPSAPSVATAPAAPAVSPTQRALMKLTEQYCQGQISAEEYRVQQKLLTDLLNEEQ